MLLLNMAGGRRAGSSNQMSPAAYHLHQISALTLLVAGVRADDVYNSTTTNDFALIADAFDTRSNLHSPDSLQSCALRAAIIFGETYEYSPQPGRGTRAAEQKTGRFSDPASLS